MRGQDGLPALAHLHDNNHHTRRTASFQLAVNDRSSALVSVDLPLNFPEQPPALSMQLVDANSSAYAMAVAGSGAARRFLPGDTAWSPRWSPYEMAQRTAGFLHDQACLMLGGSQEREGA